MSEVSNTGPRNKFEILEELHRALDSGLDGASDRQRNLLSFLVKEELEGRGDRLKAYAIATQVLGRPDDFDPQQDSIVRVEIGRLRQSLERFYLSEGKDDPVVISIPKGQYRPVFTVTPTLIAPEPAPRARPRLVWSALAALALLLTGAGAGYYFWRDAPASEPPRRGPVIAIAPFEIHADREGQSFIGGGLQLDLADILSEYRWLTVIPLGQDIAPGVKAPDMASPDFIVRASLRLIGGELAATMLLLDGPTGAVRWTNRYSLSLRASDVQTMQRDLVTKIGRDVGNPFGIVADIERAEQIANSQRSDEAFTCQMRALQYWKTFHSKDYGPAWQCFDRLSQRAGADAGSLGIRALLTLDPLNLALTRRTIQQTRADALDLAIKAHDQNSFEFIPSAARYTTALCVGDVETFRDIADGVIARFPNNPLALADVGAHYLTHDVDAERGRALIGKAREIAADLTPTDTVAIAVDALRNGVYDDRPRLRQIAAKTDDVFVLVVELALAAARADKDETARIKQRLASLGFPDQQRLSEALNSTCWSQPARDLVAAKVSLAFKGDAARP